ncbi:hypothetical protein [Natronobiforma cellulositropha]|uniref:hypothetical protein n=1 Tax=Natronobiforma cellulositropha TaxID=1679076 RepID=UPI0021D5C40B|nr:hypothetical protein [Natronobiforma cellulositropha]
MSDDNDTIAFSPALEESHIYPLVRIALIAVGGLVLLGLVSLLPGLEVLFGGFEISVSAVLLALGTYLVAGGLLAVAGRVEALVADSLEGPQRVVEDTGAIAKYLFVFVALLVAYQGFAPALVPMVENVAAAWVYHLVFLLVTLVPVALIARRLHRSLDPVTDLITRGLLDSRTRRTGEETEIPVESE